MSETISPPPRTGLEFASLPHAFDPVAQPQLFAGVLGRRVLAFILDAIVILVLMVLASIAVTVLGVLTLGAGWLLFGLVFPVVGLGYNAMTVGGPKSATLGMRSMGLEVRMWNGAKVTPLVGAFHALLFWVSLYSLVLWVPNFLWPLFDSRKRCLHDILAGVVLINRV